MQPRPRSNSSNCRRGSSPVGCRSSARTRLRCDSVVLKAGSRAQNVQETGGQTGKSRPVAGSPAVEMRKLSYGSRSEKGARTRSVLISIFRSLKQRVGPGTTLETALQTDTLTERLPTLPEGVRSGGRGVTKIAESRLRLRAKLDAGFRVARHV